MSQSGELAALRQAQREKQMWFQIEYELIHRFRANESVRRQLNNVSRDLRARRITPGRAAELLLHVD